MCVRAGARVRASACAKLSNQASSDSHLLYFQAEVNLSSQSPSPSAPRTASSNAPTVASTWLTDTVRHHADDGRTSSTLHMVSRGVGKAWHVQDVKLPSCSCAESAMLCGQQYSLWSSVHFSLSALSSQLVRHAAILTHKSSYL